MNQIMLSELLTLLYSKDLDTKLSFSPNELSQFDVLFIIVVLIAKSVIYTLGFRRSVWTNDSDTFSADYLTIPSLTISMPVSISANDVDRYAIAVQSDRPARVLTDERHLLLFLAAITEPAMLLLLAKRTCPLRPLGSVNVRNRMELLRPDLCMSLITSTTNNAVATATLTSPLKLVKRGVEGKLEVELTIPDSGNKKPIPIFRQAFTILQFVATKPSQQTQLEGSDQSAEGQSHPASVVHSLNLGGQMPLRWAAICKDYNPIHTSNLAAKFFGFRTKIAHGNHAIAMAVEVLRTRPSILPSTVEANYRPIWMETEFKRPMTIPNELKIQVIGSSVNFSTIKISQKSKLSVRAETGILSKAQSH